MNCVEQIGNPVAVFEKVSFEEYLSACKKCYDGVDEEVVHKDWENIRLPVRATKGSAGYDFFMPRPMNFRPSEYRFFPTGIRCRIDPGWVLMCCPKSGLGSKYGMRLTNTIGVIDSDYYYSDNEGHIMAGVKVGREMSLGAGDKLMQGIFLPYGTTYDDSADGVRNGGFGSTGK